MNYDFNTLGALIGGLVGGGLVSTIVAVVWYLI